MLQIEFTSNQEHLGFQHKGQELKGVSSVLRALIQIYPSQLGCSKDVAATQVDYWIDFADENLFSSDFKKLALGFDQIDNHLTLRSFMVGYQLTTADFAVFGALKACAIFNKQLKNGKIACPHLLRWFTHMNSLEYVQRAFADLETAKDEKKDRSDKGHMAIPLTGAEMSKVVTRFPPEPSGYLHIGHAKAALLNNYFARAYEGTLIVRFDDTNPSKEKVEFEESIKEDLRLLGIKADKTVHTSDHFDKIYDYAVGLIKKGLAYVDDTDTDTMRNQRFDGIESENRSQTIDVALKKFEEMKNGTEYGLKCCLRAKINMSDPNKCLRDPVIYRCNLTPHHVKGDQWKMYPTYDFACPIVDSLDGVTHALRTIEYRDRNPQYQWFIDNLGLRPIIIWDYSRLAFVFTLLSKRKLQWFVDNGHVSGWDDPRFPTVRGIRRRGMTVEALLNYILSQGASQREILLEWDKIWAANKKVIDPVAPRHTAISKQNSVSVEIIDNVVFEQKLLLKHKKNPNIGEKLTNFGQRILMEQADCAALELGEEFTLMDWGNGIVKDLVKHGEVIVSMTIELNLEGDFKKTKKKLTWLCEGIDKNSSLVNLVLSDFDYLITKKKLEEDDKFEDFLNPVTVFQVEAFGDCNLRNLKEGEIIQLERKGYYICDKAFDEISQLVKLNFIPDGKSDTVGLKSFPQSTTDLAKTPSMYPMKSFHDVPFPKKDTLYQIESIYGSESVLIGDRNPTGPPSQTEKVDQIELKSSKAKNAPQPQETESSNSISAISKLDIVVGRVLDVKKHPDADSLYIESIDIGEPEPRQVVSGLVKFMQPEEIMGKTLVVLKNLKPVSMRGLKSFAMVLCASNSDHTKVEFLIPPENSLPGEKIYFEGHQGIPELQLNPKKKVWEEVQVDFKTTDDLVAVWKGIPFRTIKGVVKSASIAGASIK